VSQAGQQAIHFGFEHDFGEVHGAEFAACAAETDGGIDVLVCNAGMNTARPAESLADEDWEASIRLNLGSAWYPVRAALPHMLERGSGAIINMGSVDGLTGDRNMAAYNAAKGGVHGLTTGLAREFAKNGITVNTVAPCMVATPPVKKLMGTGNPLIEKFTDVIPMGRPGEMEEVASMVAYLASDEASFVTGQVISVNGGSTML